MLFMFIGEVKEPQKETWAKAVEVEKRRNKDGSAQKMNQVTPMYRAANSAGTTYWVVDCSWEDVNKWFKDYGDYVDCEAFPVIARADFEKL
jgi:hypothetical protein